MQPLLVPAVLVSPVLAGWITTTLFGRRDRTNAPPGLLFHSIVKMPGREMSHFQERQFAAFCAYLQREQYTTLGISQAKGATPDPSGKKQLLITFDDGLQSYYENAFPLLQKHNLTSTIFCLGNGFGGFSTWDVYTKNRHLSRQEIRVISDHGHEIGSHTMTHPCLTYLTSKSVTAELRNSRKALEDIIGKAVTSLAFPYGAWNRRVWDIAREEGYTAATLYRGAAYENHALLPVLGVYQYDNVDSLVSKIAPTSLSRVHIARARMMAHFARGTPVWKYRREYGAAEQR